MHYPIGLIVCGLVLVLFRLHSFGVPLETDECNYAYIGERLLAGDRLYVDVWDHQPPGVFVIFAAVQAVMGSEPLTFRAMAIVFSLASMVLIGAILRRSCGDLIALLGAFVFALSSTDPGTAGEGCNREIYMNTLVLLAWWAAGWKEKTGRIPWGVVVAGIALGLASVIKTIIAIHWLFLMIWLIGVTLHREGPIASRVKSAALTVLWFGLGPACIWIFVGGYFAATHRWAEFVDAVFAANLSYAGQSEAFITRFTQFYRTDRHPFTFDSAIALWVGSAVAAIWLAGRAIVSVHRWEAISVLFLLLGGYVAICLPAQFWPHYYYLMIPPAVVAVVYSMADVRRAIASVLPAREREPRSPINVATMISLAIAAIVVGSTMYTQYRDYYSQPPVEITWKRYITRDFWGKVQGENVAAVTSPKDTVFVYANDASIYYYSGRRCASRFTMVTGLREGYRGVEKRRANLLADIAKNKPKVVILTFDQDPFPEWVKYLEENYSEQPVGWDFNDCTGDAIMAVLVRKGETIPSVNWDWDRSEIGGRCPENSKPPEMRNKGG